MREVKCSSNCKGARRQLHQAGGGGRVGRGGGGGSRRLGWRRKWKMRQEMRERKMRGNWEMEDEEE